MANAIIRAIVVNLRQLAESKKTRLAVLLIAALTYNNWLLGPWLNLNLFQHDGSISELSVGSQPYHWIFRGLDIFSGCLIILLAILFKNRLQGQKFTKIILIFTAILGAANILDAFFSLSCSETLNPNCHIPISLSLSNYQMPSHAYSSVLIGLCYFGLPVAGMAYGLLRKSKFLSLISMVAVLEAIASFISAILNYINLHSFSVRTAGSGQEVQMLIVAIWLVGFYTYIDNR